MTTTEPSDCGLPISIFILDGMLSFRSVVDELQLGRLFRSESATERFAIVCATAFGRGDGTIRDNVFDNPHMTIRGV